MAGQSERSLALPSTTAKHRVTGHVANAEVAYRTVHYSELDAVGNAVHSYPAYEQTAVPVLRCTRSGGVWLVVSNYFVLFGRDAVI